MNEWMQDKVKINKWMKDKGKMNEWMINLKINEWKIKSKWMIKKNRWMNER